MGDNWARVGCGYGGFDDAVGMGQSTGRIGDRLVSGEEELDERWPNTPVLTIHKIQVVKE